jgi:hypothetical protein
MSSERGIGSPRHSLMSNDRVGDGWSGDVEEGAEEVVGIDLLLAERCQGGGGEVACVERDDALGAGDDGGREDVSVATPTFSQRLEASMRQVALSASTARYVSRRWRVRRTARLPAA